MKEIRIALIGFGGMGKKYAEWIYMGSIEKLRLTGICCRNMEGQCFISQNYPEVNVYIDSNEMFSKTNEYDAVLLATPHKEHVRLAIEAARAGIHILCDKPIGIHTKEVKELYKAVRDANVKMAMIFNLRANPVFKKARDMVQRGDVGRITRAIWICNQWYRTSCYHNSSPWRSSWSGEGGGLLLNQCQHNLDIWQWILGMPANLYASLDFGKYHDIMVDDSDILIFDYDSGMKGTLIASTGDAPGTNRFEIFGTNGKLIIENGKRLYFDKNEISTDEFDSINKELYGSPSHVVNEISTNKNVNMYVDLLQNFTNHLLFEEPLIAPGTEGISALSIANAAYLSAWLGKTITLPIDDKLYVRMLEQRIAMEQEGNT